MKLLSREYLLCVVQGPVRFFVAKRDRGTREIPMGDLLTERVNERESDGFYLNVPQRLFDPLPDLLFARKPFCLPLRTLCPVARLRAR